ncbi:MAG: DinB family protein [Chloroflexota bacterium]
MKTEFTWQYEHTWRVFERLVRGFDPEAWLHTGRGAIIPARLSLHILQAARYYMQAPTPVFFASGKAFDGDWATVEEADLPSQDDVLACIEELKAKCTQWLAEMDFEGENSAFEWAGRTKLGVVLFLLRHNLFHIGELSSLLNESRNGDVEDHYVKAL